MPQGGYQYQDLRKLDTDHLKNILITERQIVSDYIVTILAILDQRAKEAGALEAVEKIHKAAALERGENICDA